MTTYAIIITIVCFASQLLAYKSLRKLGEAKKEVLEKIEEREAILRAYQKLKTENNKLDSEKSDLLKQIKAFTS